MNESIVTKTTITLPMNGGALEAVSTIETVPYWTRSRKSGNIFLKYLYIWFKALQQNICTLSLQPPKHGLTRPRLTSLRRPVRLPAHQSQNHFTSEHLEEGENTTLSPKQ